MPKQFLCCYMGEGEFILQFTKQCRNLLGNFGLGVQSPRWNNRYFHGHRRRTDRPHVLLLYCIKEGTGFLIPRKCGGGSRWVMVPYMNIHGFPLTMSGLVFKKVLKEKRKSSKGPFRLCQWVPSQDIKSRCREIKSQYLQSSFHLLSCFLFLSCLFCFSFLLIPLILYFTLSSICAHFPHPH